MRRDILFDLLRDCESSTYTRSDRGIYYPDLYNRSLDLGTNPITVYYIYNERSVWSPQGPLMRTPPMSGVPWAVSARASILSLLPSRTLRC